jgi:hypothetical protein
MGLWKEDVDTDEWVVTIRRSWSKPWPKDHEPRTVLVTAELRQLLLAAMRSSRNHLVFPRSSGEVFEPGARRLLVDNLRRACAKAGVVTTYEHTCRRCKGRRTRGIAGAPAEVTWRYPDVGQRLCPHCKMKLWAKAIPRPVRFYDLRHSNATLLRKGGVDLGAVQKALGHSSPELTAAIYDHSELADYRDVLERALSFGTPRRLLLGPGALRFGEPVGKRCTIPISEGPGPEAEASDSGPFDWSGRQDSNLRPLGPEPALGAVHALSGSGKPSQALDDTGIDPGHAVESLPPDPPNGADGSASADQVAADLRRTEYLRPEGLLSVRAVAERLELSAATVYNDINAGRLRWVLFGSVRRVRPEDLGLYAQTRGRPLSRAP